MGLPLEEQIPAEGIHPSESADLDGTPVDDATTSAPGGGAPGHASRPEMGRADTDSGALERRVRMATSVIAPTTIIGALLFYYGYVATAAEYGYFGLSLGTLGLSTQDVLLRSVAALYLPLGMLCALCLLGAWLHAAVQVRIGDYRMESVIRTGSRWLVIGGWIALALAVAGISFPFLAMNQWLAFTPASLGTGISAVAYGKHLQKVSGASSTRPRRSGAEVVMLSAVIGLVLLSLFWATNSFAAAYGRGRAELLVRDIDRLPGVVVDATERLFTAAEGVEEFSLVPPDEGQAFRYRYRGMRLLVTSDGRLFLLPRLWQQDSGRILVVHETDVRLQFHN